MKKNEIVWIYGGSAAGKETFINFIAKGKSQELIARLGWAGKKIIPCLESIEWIAQSEDDPRGPRRSKIPEVIKKLNLLNTNAVILIKGQDIDLQNNRLRETKKFLHENQHKIIYIYTDIDEVFERLKDKPWWENSFTKDMVKDWLKHQLKYLHELKNDFKVVSLNGNSGGNYREIPFPEVNVIS